MNKIKHVTLCTLALCIMAMLTFAQAPNLINYQGVAINSNGTPMSNSTVKIKIGISSGNSTSMTYSEDRLVTTDAQGLFHIQIGSPGATNIFGTMASIPWNNQSKTLHVFMDPNGGNNFLLMGTQQLVSVPYSLHAKEAASIASNAVVNLSNLSSVGVSNGSILQHNGTNWVASSILPLNDTDASAVTLKITNTASGGTAVQGKATHTNPNSNGVLGEGNGGSSVGVRATNTTGFAVYATSSPTGTNPVVYGMSNGTSGSGVKGKSDGVNGYGVYGESMSGKGVFGYGNNTGSVGVHGNSLVGTGVKASSFSGTALEVDGNLKIAGGNTTPGRGKVLTSDTAGNAQWAENLIGFKVDLTTNSAVVPNASYYYSTSGYYIFDYGDCFNFSGPSADQGAFIAPITGFYHFDNSIRMRISSLAYSMRRLEAKLVVNGLASWNTIDHSSYSVYDESSYSYASLQFSEDIFLYAGDKVKLRLYQENGGALNATIMTCMFAGHLIAAY